MTAGRHAWTKWQASQRLVVGKWVAGLPVAWLPLWQVLQPLAMEAWSKVAGVQALIEQDAPLAVERRLETGAPVRIKTGSLRGLEGIVVKRHGKTRLLVAVNYLQQGVSVEIDDCALEPL